MTGFKGFDRFDLNVLIGGLLFTLMYEQSLTAILTSITIWIMISTLETLFRRKKPRTIPTAPASALKPQSRGGMGSSAIRHGRARPRNAPKSVASLAPKPVAAIGPATVHHFHETRTSSYSTPSYMDYKPFFDTDIAKKQAQGRITDAMDRLRAAGHHSIAMGNFRAYCLSTMRASEYEEGIRAITDMPTLTRHTIHGPGDTLLLLTY